MNIETSAMMSSSAKKPQQQFQSPSQHQQFSQQTQQQFQQGNSYQCTQCGIILNSAESLDVHLQYHNNDNLAKNWNMSSSQSEETNNNTNNIKREFISNITSGDSSDSIHKHSPEYAGASPEMLGHPPTPQSYHSAASPYQNQDTPAFSPNFQNFQPQQIKTERSSPSLQYQNYNSYPEQQFFVDTSQSQQYSQEFIQKIPVPNSSYRFQPYQKQHSPFDRSRSQTQVPSSSPAYPPQPTPSPSPKQCDKCGYVCESASQLIEHLNMAHPPTPAPHLTGYQSNQHFMFGNEHPPVQIKTEEDPQSEILDLDSHKVHQVFPEEEKRQNGDNNHNPHSVSAMLNSWPPSEPQQSKIFPDEQHGIFISNANEPKIFQQQNIPENKLFPPEPKMFQAHQMHNQEYMGNGVTTTTHENVNINNMSPMGQQAPQAYRPFEHLPSQQNPPVISSTQVPNNPAQATTPNTKSASWKSNEARRPKTYNCTACNKWFTSSGHLKRHYNTTLHKNAVKSSGQPDPASLPISAHHHPARDPPANREDISSGSPGQEARSDSNSMPPQFDRPGLLQQSPNGVYDRQPAPNIHHTPPLHSPMPLNPSPLMNNSLLNPNSPVNNSLMNPNLSNGSPPNGEAGPSPNILESRGLLSLSTTMANTGSTGQHPHGFNMAPPMVPMESPQFQMYPNESAPHVTQDMDISNLNTTGEFQFDSAVTSQQSGKQTLPSIALFNPQRYGLLLGYGNANVGGGGSVTTPYTSYYSDPYDASEARTLMYRTEEDEYKLTVLTTADTAPHLQELMVYTTENNDNNNHSDLSTITSNSDQKIFIMEDIKIEPASPEKAHIKRDYEENTSSPLISSSTANSKPGLHKCFDCDKIFNRACYLTQHNKTFHSGDKPFKCTRCGKRFSCETTYQEHAVKHAGDKPHKCELCPKQFNHKTDLRRHMCLHTGQKPYSCDTCGKGFIRKDHMMKHCETHTRKTQAQSKVALIR